MGMMSRCTLCHGRWDQGDHEALFVVASLDLPWICKECAQRAEEWRARNFRVPVMAFEMDWPEDQ